MTSTSILELHLHSNDDPHRLTAVNGSQLRCWDCQQTLDLGAVLGVRPSSAKSTSTSQTAAPLNIRDAAACPEHKGERAESCGPCRSERLAPASLVVPEQQEANA
jgi:hypothetical protein